MAGAWACAVCAAIARSRAFRSSRASPRARVRSPAEAKRSSGRLAIALLTIASSHSGTAGAIDRTEGTGSLTCANTFATLVGRSNGSLPVSASKSMQPNE